MSGYLSGEEEEALTDEAALAASLRHPSIFARLVEKYEAPFLRKAFSIVRDEREAEDIVQEAFTKIYLNAKRFKPVPGATFSSWGYRILINTALTHYAKRKREFGQRADLEPELMELLPDHSMRQFEKSAVSDEVASVLSRMPAPLARALSNFLIEGKSQEEIAKLEGVSVGAIKTRVHRAKQEFKKIYKSITHNI
ncbi:MAG TPA: RNA polymerase sigma factor [Candidatus Paceibacterota bacterium]|nr:RNA polymerase sigma factor [Candidatus Paceibacterota bacterium]